MHYCLLSEKPGHAFLKNADSDYTVMHMLVHALLLFSADHCVHRRGDLILFILLPCIVAMMCFCLTNQQVVLWFLGHVHLPDR